MIPKFRKPTPEEQKLKKKALKEAESARAQMVVRHAFVGMLAMRMDLVTVVDSRLPTACTDGNTIYFNAEFLMGLDNKKRIYLMAHEVWHCVFLHFQRRGNRNHRKFNVAADLEVDFMLEEEGFDVFDMLPYEESLRGKSAEEIYDLLPEDASRPDSADQHIYEDTEIPDPGKGQSGKKPKNENEPEGTGSKSFNEDAQDDDNNDVVLDPDYVPSVSKKAAREWRRRVISAAQQVKRNRGSLPAYLEQMIRDQYQPELSWREILQQFVSACFGGSRQWLPPSRRHMAAGLYLPSRKEEFLSVTVAIDTSGSTMNDLPSFLAELKGIVSSFGRYEVTLIECDMEIQNVRKFTEWEPFEYEMFDFKGFGGTSFTPVFDYIKENIEEPNLLIYLTDGYGDAPIQPPRYPVLWVLTSDGVSPAEWGESTWLNQSYTESETI